MALQVFHSPAEWAARLGPAGKPVVLTVGNFDGLHRGHQQILRAVAERARAQGGLAGAVTFDPHPLRILRPGEAPPLIATLGQRLQGLEEVGVETALVQKFDLAFSRLSAEEFVRDLLLAKLGMRAILVGENFRFGHRQAGDIHVLAELGRRLGFAMEIIPRVVVRGEVVSSSGVRQAILQGEVGRAVRLLGRPFAVAGEIRRGTGRGLRLLFPTLNLAPEQELLPARGVYATETRVAGWLYRSATNVGVRPTFDGSGLSIESHLFDFSEELRAGPMEVRFWKRLREERKFIGPEALRAQIEKDLARARKFFRRFDRGCSRQPA
jgi:riboflavin kinase/FMN adenylyltransferase